MGRLVVRLFINAVAIWAASEIISGVSLTDQFWGVVLVALVFGVINALIKPVLTFLGFPLIVVTLGLFTLVINAGLLTLTSWLTPALDVAGFWPAIWGALMVSLVSWFLGIFLGGKEKKKK